jgi:hypothetical protein
MRVIPRHDAGQCADANRLRNAKMPARGPAWQLLWDAERNLEPGPHLLLCNGTVSESAEKRAALKGHGFSRAAEATK